MVADQRGFFARFRPDATGLPAAAARDCETIYLN